ncbi:MAG: DUF5011 domain-containing protein, partial [Opitutales bacterium]|nr:DUF5011 domain-containing protein [Opitutales bacterium]
MTLLGDTTITLEAGSPFDDPGLIAGDDRDGDLTDTVYLDNALPRSGIVYHLDASTLENLTDGERLTEWEDKSSNGLTFAASATAPRFKGKGLRGNPAVTFTGSENLVFNGDAGLSGQPSMTVLMAARPSHSSARRFMKMGAVNAAPGKMLSFAQDSSIRYNNGEKIWSSSGFKANEPTLAVFQVDLARGYTDGRYWLNSLEAFSNDVVLGAGFDASAEGFSYEDDMLGTNQANRAEGNYDASGGFSGGGLLTRLGPGGGGNNGPFSGGWSQEITLAQNTDLEISLRFRLTMGEGFENDEWGGAWFKVNNTMHGNAQGNYLVRMVGNGNGGGTDDSGWLSETFNVNLSGGKHTLSFGAYNSKATADDEITQVWVDDLKVEKSVSASTKSATLPTTSFEIIVGADRQASGQFRSGYQGDIHEIVVFNRILLPGELQAWGTNLQFKYGTAGTYSPFDTNMPGTYTLNYKVEDSAGNMGQTTRTVKVIDTTPPIIDLKGGNVVRIDVGFTYLEPGFSAMDSTDGDLTERVVVTSPAIDTSRSGIYEVEYDVNDENGNVAEKTIRTVVVRHPELPVEAYWKFDESEGLVAEDSSGNSFHGTLKNFSGSDAWTAGKVGNSLTFDGSNDYIEIPAELGIPPEMTLGVWIKRNNLINNARKTLFWFKKPNEEGQDGFILSIQNGPVSFRLRRAPGGTGIDNIITGDANRFYTQDEWTQLDISWCNVDKIFTVY